MADNYLEFKCPNLPYADSSWTCNGEMGGVSLSTLQAVDYSKAKYDDIRYCGKCRAFWHVTVGHAGESPTYTLVQRKANEKNINFVSFFAAVKVYGKKILRIA